MLGRTVTMSIELRTSRRICLRSKVLKASTSACILEYRCNQHDQGYVEREAITALGLVYRKDLIGIGCDWGQDEAKGWASAW